MTLTECFHVYSGGRLDEAINEANKVQLTATSISQAVTNNANLNQVTADAALGYPV